MIHEEYRSFLQEKNLGTEAINAAIAIVKRFDQHASERGRSADTANADDAATFSERLIADGENTFDQYCALFRYGLFVRNRTLYSAMIELLDGAEAYGNLFAKLADELGEAKRDALFEESPVPPLGTPNTKKPALVQHVLAKLEADEPEVCQRILSNGLRDLHDEWYEDAKTDFAACGSLDAYLAKKADDFLAELSRHQEEGTWWFVQEITDDVLNYVRAHPEVSGGIRDGNILYEAKIPYLAKEWLAESDPQKKRYLYCHCPWVRESLRAGEPKVSPVFCNCSAAFHKKLWEVIFEQELQADVVESILKGDDRCLFAIHLPVGVS